MKLFLILLFICLNTSLYAETRKPILGPLTQLVRDECCCVFFGNMAGNPNTHSLYVDAYKDGHFYILKVNSEGIVSVVQSSAFYLGKPRCTPSNLWYLTEEGSSNDTGCAQIASCRYNDSDVKLETDFSISILDYYPTDCNVLLLGFRGISKRLVLIGQQAELLLSKNQTTVVDVSSSSGSLANVWTSVSKQHWELSHVDLNNGTSSTILRLTTPEELYRPTYDSIRQDVYLTTGMNIIRYSMINKEFSGFEETSGHVLDLFIMDDKIYYTVKDSSCSADFNLYYRTLTPLSAPKHIMSSKTLLDALQINEKR